MTNPKHPGVKYPSSSLKYPLEDLPYDLKNKKRCVFLKNIIKKKNISVGDYSYYDDPDGPDDFEENNVLYHYEFSLEKLIIKKFVAIAAKAKFIMSGANHKLDGFSTFPFGIFGHGWEKLNDLSNLPSKGDTILENDIWIGYDATIMPGVTINNGAIIGSKAVVTKDVPPYAIVAGNPAKIVKMRFSENIINELLKIKWWDWDIIKITRNIPLIINANIEELKKAK